MDEIPINLANEEVLELATAFVEKYASFLEELPFDLQRKVTRLREIDCDYREILSEIEELHESFIKEKDLNVARKSTHCLCKIQYLLGRCQVLGDEKISIVQQVSETIENKKKAVEHSGYRFQSLYRTDQKNECNGKREMARMDYSKATKRPRRREKTDKDKESLLDGGNDDDDALLDFALSNSNAIVYSEKQKSNASHETSGTGGVSNKSTESSHSKHELLSSRKSDKLIKKEPSPASSSSSSSVISSTVSSQKSSSNKTTSFKSAMPSSKATISTIFNGSNKSLAKKKKKIKKKQIEKPVRSPSPGPELPIDPDEPTYCLCDQVSYGQMIGCDNKKCPIEWFHFSCVGLSHKPKGKWYCPDCTKGMKDRKRDSKKDYHR